MENRYIFYKIIIVKVDK